MTQLCNMLFEQLLIFKKLVLSGTPRLLHTKGVWAAEMMKMWVSNMDFATSKCPL